MHPPSAARWGPARKTSSHAILMSSRKTANPIARVVLGPNAVRRALAECSAGEDETFNAMLAVDSDGAVFINYLGDLFVADDPDTIVRALYGHRQFVAAQREAVAHDLRLAIKYEWMAAYHDWFVRTQVKAQHHDLLVVDPERPLAIRRFC